MIWSGWQVRVAPTPAAVHWATLRGITARALAMSSVCPGMARLSLDL